MWLTLLSVAVVVLILSKGPGWPDFLWNDTPNYRAFGVSVPGEYTITGLDVSRYQGKIDWKKVKKMKSGKLGVGFVFAKSTEGLSLDDPHFERNRKQCKKHDIPFGAYHYFIPGADPVKQADFFVSRFKPEKGNLPPVADIESAGGFGVKEVRDFLKIFLKRVETQTGTRPIIYTYHSFYRDYLSTGFEAYVFWIAHYGPGKPHDQPWTFWQFSEQSTVSGIAQPVDLNVFKGDSAAFEKLKVK